MTSISEHEAGRTWTRSRRIRGIRELATLPAPLDALNAAVDDRRRARKPLDGDAAILLLIRNLADIADRDAPSANDLRLCSADERLAVIAARALLDIAGNSVAGDRTRPVHDVRACSANVRC